MRFILRCLNYLASFLRLVCLILVIALPVTVFFKVFFRYVVGSPLVWSDELIMIMLLTLTYFGAALAVHNRSHITVEILEAIIKKWGDKPLKIYRLILDMVFLSVLTLIIVYGVKISFFSADQVTDIMMISYFWVYLILPIGMIFMFLMILKRIIEDFTGAEIPVD